MVRIRNDNLDKDDELDDSTLGADGEDVVFDDSPKEEEEDEVRDTDDGGAIITFANEKDHAFQSEHFANIVEDVDAFELNKIVHDLLDKLERDKEARSKRDEQYADGIRRTGLGDDAPGGAQFTGANKVVHPMLTEVCVDFSARAMKELFPSGGPVKSKIIGKPTKAKTEKADRKSKFMNWQLTEQMPEFRSELEQLTTQLPLGGVQYMKLFWNEKLERVESQFIPLDQIYLPFAASNFYSAERKTHVQLITKFEFECRVETGMYKDVDLINADQIDWTKAQTANNKVEGKTVDPYDDDGLRTIFEIYTYADFEDDKFLPYVITVDKTTKECLCIYRNWDPRDEKNHEPLISIIEFPFIPWRGAYPIGMTQMIGGLCGAATGSLRALLDTAHINNIPTMIKLKGAENGQNLNPQPTEVMVMDGGIGVDDIRKIAMPMPFNPPSPVLFQLLGFLIDAGKGVVQTSFEKLSDQNPNMPVGTTLALIEQGMVVFSAIHARLHNAMAHVLKVLHRLNSAYLTEEMVIDEIGEKMVDPSDFDGPIDVIPVSDPTIFSETQRFAQIQAIQQRAAMMPQLYDLRKVEELFLKTMKIPQGEDLLVPKAEPKDLDPISENVAASVGKPIGALPQQNHIAHMKVHLAFLQSPLFGQNPGIAPMFIPAMVNHLKDHLLMHYMSISTQGIDLAEKQGMINGDDDMQQAQAAVEALATIEQVFDQQFLPIYTQAVQAAQQLQPPQPQDPNQLTAQVQQAAIQQRAQSDQMQLQAKQQADQMNMQAKQQSEQLQAQLQQAKDEMAKQMQEHQLMSQTALEQMKQSNENQRKQAELDTRIQMNTADNETAKELAAVEVMSGEKFAVSTGTGVNPGV